MFKIIWICLESWLLLMNMGCISRGKGFIDQQNMFYFVMEKIAIWRRHRSSLRSRLTNLTIPLITKTWFSPVPQLMSTSSVSPRSPWPKKSSPAKWKTLSRQGGCFVHFKASKHDLFSIQTIVGYQGRTRVFWEEIYWRHNGPCWPKSRR